MASQNSTLFSRPYVAMQDLEQKFPTPSLPRKIGEMSHLLCSEESKELLILEREKKNNTWQWPGET